jgi:hypothetical protein
MVPRVDRGHNMGNYFTVVSMGKWGRVVRGTLRKYIFKCVFQCKIIKKIFSRSATPDEFRFT